MEFLAGDYAQAPDFERFGLASPDSQTGRMVSGLPSKGTASDQRAAFSHSFTGWLRWNPGANQVA